MERKVVLDKLIGYELLFNVYKGKLIYNFKATHTN